ncbi:unnamed protein product [Chrysoparadoxa australica]
MEAQVDQTDDMGRTALWRAAERGLTQEMADLIGKGAALNAGCHANWSPLGIASSRGHADCVKALLEAGAEVDLFSGERRSALHAACEAGHLPVVQLLLHYGADVNACTQTMHLTPLLLAVREEREDTAVALLEAGADVTIRDAWGSTALHYAAVRASLAVLQRLLSCKAGAVNHPSAPPRGQPLTSFTEFMRTADPDALDDDGETPLVACQRHYQNHSSAGRSRKEQVVKALTAASSRNALWRGRRLVVLLEARHVGGEAIEGGGNGAGEAKLRELLMWLVSDAEQEQQALFRCSPTPLCQLIRCPPKLS